MLTLFSFMHSRIIFAFVRNKDYNFPIEMESSERFVNSFNKWITLGLLEGHIATPFHFKCSSGFHMRKEKTNSMVHLCKKCLEVLKSF